MRKRCLIKWILLLLALLFLAGCSTQQKTDTVRTESQTISFNELIQKVHNHEVTSAVIYPAQLTIIAQTNNSKSYAVSYSEEDQVTTLFLDNGVSFTVEVPSVAKD